MENTRILTIFAGINGAGKSTLYYSFGTEKFGVRLNTDEIVKNRGQDWRNINAQLAAAKTLFEVQNYCLENGISFNRETTLSGFNILKTIEQAKSKSYKVNLMFIGIDDISIAKKRIENRVKHGGHGISDDVINSRYSHLFNNLIKVLPRCDSVQFYDNSTNCFILVGFKKNNSIVKIRNCKWLDKLIYKLNNSIEKQ